VREAARLFAAGPKGMASSGTGPSMAPRCTLSEQLIITLNSLCGRYPREGEAVANPGVLSPPLPRRAQAARPAPAWGGPVRSRVRGLGQIRDELPTPALADEILLPGEGQVKAFISVGANPVVSFPDQLKTIEAMKTLELSVALDTRPTPTTRMCDYVIACTLYLERADATTLADLWFPQPFAQYTPAMVDRDPGVIHEWEFFWEISRRLGRQLVLAGGALAMDEKPTTDQVLDLITAGSRVPLDEVRQHPGGALFPDSSKRIQPRTPGTGARFAAGHPDVIAELRAVRAESFGDAGGYGSDDGFSHRLIGRRHLEVFNSTGQEVAGLRSQLPHNAAYMSPLDMRELGLAPGDLVEITSDRASIVGVVAATDELAPGVIAMAHSWGDTPEHDGRVREIGANTNRLVSTDHDFDPISGIPRMNALPVNVRPVPTPAPAHA
jgi:anaerobic selenocysteine-containing dehydrogenase